MGPAAAVVAEDACRARSAELGRTSEIAREKRAWRFSRAVLNFE